MHKANINDVAAAAGVSIKTVSRVFNNEPNVREATREKVLKAARNLNYTPSVSARSLASRRSHVIVHFHDNPNPDYVERMYRGLNAVCRQSGYFCVSESVEAGADNYAASIGDYLTIFQVDGVILTPPLCDDPAILRALDDKSIPFVLVSPSRDSDTAPNVKIDDVAAAGVMTQHLIDLGHTHIGFIKGPQKHHSASRRLRGFKKTLQDAGLDESLCPVVDGDFSYRRGFEAFADILAANPEVTAIFAGNDEMAVGAMTAALKAGYTVPDDMSFAGFDASRVSEIVWPPLTTIRQPVKAMAQKSGALLLERIREGEPRAYSTELDYELLIRKTTAKPGK